MKKILGVLENNKQHWVGDGFPVRTLFSYDGLGQQISPFLLFDYAGPTRFEPSDQPRGVGQHPHRGFETVTIVYEGEVAHRDSTGKGGTIGPGDVQWMTAASGILHEEFHSPAFTRSGGNFRVVQLWVNLPARDKMATPGYQAILNTDIPSLVLPGARIRVIAGDFQGTRGPARSFTPINLWDVRMDKGATLQLELPEGHNAAVAVLSGAVSVNGEKNAGDAQVVLLDPAGTAVQLEATDDAMLLVMTGEPIREPIAGYGPFVMNSEAEIRRAITDFNNGRFGQIAASTA
ncbi:MAG TPA: pirin family protein [Rhizomicrobium sp.]|nr:pirin family protein [Rhizomicrobium sp.]